MSGEECKPSKHKGAEGASGVHSSFPEAGAALMGAAGIGGGAAGQGGKPRPNLYLVASMIRSCAELRRQQHPLISHSGCGNHPNVHHDVMEK